MFLVRINVAEERNYHLAFRLSEGNFGLMGWKTKKVPAEFADGHRRCVTDNIA